MQIFTWVCEKCGWANDNNNGPCRKCGAKAWIGQAIRALIAQEGETK